jgi:transposase InsO family protein
MRVRGHRSGKMDPQPGCDPDALTANEAIWQPQFIHSDNGAEFTASAVMRWLRDQNIGPAFIAPGRPWQNGYVGSFHGKLRDECLKREWFRDAREARSSWNAGGSSTTTSGPTAHPAIGHPIELGRTGCNRTRSAKHSLPE